MNDTQILLALIRTVFFGISLWMTAASVVSIINALHAGRGKFTFVPAIWAWVIWFASMQYVG